MAKWSYFGFILGLVITIILFDTLALALIAPLYWIIAIIYIGFFVALMIHLINPEVEKNKFLVGYCIGSTGLIIGLIVLSILKPKETPEQIRREKNREKYQCIRCNYKAKDLDGMQEHIDNIHGGEGSQMYRIIKNKGSL